MNFKSIKEALEQPRSKYFWIKYGAGKFETGNTMSFYSDKKPDKYLSFDVSNSAIQACCGLNGSINSISIYRGSYRVEGSPGMWWYKDYSMEGLFSFSIKTANELIDLNDVDWPAETSLLANIFPVTELKGEKLGVTLITYAPVSADGKKRPRALIYGMLVKNTSGDRIKGDIFLPRYSRGDFNNLTGSGCFSINFIGDTDCKSQVAFDLAPGEEIWTPAVFSVPGENEVVDEINSMGSLYWLNDTWSFFKGLTGLLSMQDDEFAGEFLERMVHLALGCINTDGKGNLIGCNTGIGSATTNCFILLKDIFYYFLPFSILDTEFYKEGILWSLDYCIRPQGRVIPIERIDCEKAKNTKTGGGVSHSLSIALMPVTMAGLYYANTGDKEFFICNTSLKERLTDILEQVIRSRKKEDVWLFPSDYISDFPAYGDYHTGSNVVAWNAFKSFSRILDEVYSDVNTAHEYNDIACKIKYELESRNIIDGPFGKQYIEGVNEDGSIPVMGHEGEESDTTLMPFYGYLDYDNPVYRNYSRFSLSEHNCFYKPIARGISPGAPDWGFAISGHMTGLANVVDFETMNGENGYMTEIKKLTDVDGSLWWWPYAFKAEEYGKVVRSREDLAAKSGWAAGVFSAMFITQILGIKYDAPTKTLYFRPFSPSSSFSWENFRIGTSVFNIAYSKNQCDVTVNVNNKNDYEITLNLEVILDKDVKVRNITINDENCPIVCKEGMFLDKPTIKLSDVIVSGESKKIKFIKV